MNERKFASPVLGRPPDVLPVGIRVYPEPILQDMSEELANNSHAKRARSGSRPDDHRTYLVLDTETTADTVQRIKFGSYCIISDGVCVEEALFYADDLPHAELAVLKQYVAAHKHAALLGRSLSLITLAEFHKVLYANVYKARFALVGFNLPFDLSRIAFEWTGAYCDYAGGFSLGLWYATGPEAQDILAQTGVYVPNPYRPRIAIRQIDSRRALIGFLARRSPDKADLIPENSGDGTPVSGYVYPGKFIDLRTLGFALTSKSLSLDS